jgi:hypothetical protein
VSEKPLNSDTKPLNSDAKPATAPAVAKSNALKKSLSPQKAPSDFSPGRRKKHEDPHEDPMMLSKKH